MKVRFLEIGQIDLDNDGIPNPTPKQKKAVKQIMDLNKRNAKLKKMSRVGPNQQPTNHPS